MKRIVRGSSAAADTDARSRSTAALSGTTGIVLDPIFSLRQRIRLVLGIGAPHCDRHRIGSGDGRSARP
jgi:hypothetical protein